MPRVIRRRPIADRFWEKVQKSDGCWLWMGSRKPNGYGSFHDQVGGVKTRWNAHRLAYTLAIGPIPPGLDVCHTCDIPPCCNPAHLTLGTHRANMHDAIAKGRWNPRQQLGTRRLPVRIKNERKTHCKRGHERTLENTYRTKNGNALCRPCTQERERLKYKALHP